MFEVGVRGEPLSIYGTPSSSYNEKVIGVGLRCITSGNVICMKQVEQISCVGLKEITKD